MGNAQSEPVHNDIDVLTTWDHGAIRKMHAIYTSSEMDFGLTKEQVDILFSGNDELSAAIVDATKSNNGLVNALMLLGGLNLITKGTLEEKVQFVFDMIDFSGNGKITMDEMTIAFLCAIRGYQAYTTTTFPSFQDTEVEDIVVQCYLEMDKTNNEEILKQEYTTWILKKLQLCPNVLIGLSTLGLKVPSKKTDDNPTKKESLPEISQASINDPAASINDPAASVNDPAAFVNDPAVSLDNSAVTQDTSFAATESSKTEESSTMEAPPASAAGENDVLEGVSVENEQSLKEAVVENKPSEAVSEESMPTEAECATELSKLSVQDKSPDPPLSTEASTNADT